MDEKASFHGAVVKHLSDIAGQLAVFLDRILPPLFNNWWNQAVVMPFRSNKKVVWKNAT